MITGTPPSAPRSAARTRHPSGRTPPAPAGRSSLRGGGHDRITTAQVVLAAIVAVLCLIGLVMVLSASSVVALRDDGSSWLYFRRQLVWVLAGTTVLVLAARMDYHRLRRLGLPLLVLSMILLVAVLLPGTGITVGGSTRWLGVGAWRFQPSELAKLGLLLFGADLLARRGHVSSPSAALSSPPRRGLQPRPGRSASRRAASATRPMLLAFGVVALLVLRQPDLGTTLVAGCIVFCLLYVGGTPLKAMTALVATAAAAAFVLGMAEPYRRERMLSFLNPWADASNTGYQVVQSLVGLGTGRITGVGVGASRAKWGFLPNAHTDFIFSILGEELGMVGSLLVLVLFMAFAVLGVRAALRAPDRYGMLLAAGITAWVIGQAFINIGAVVGAIPVSGVPLPFVSFGGTSLVLLMGAVGVLLNVAGQARSLERPSTGRSPSAR